MPVVREGQQMKQRLKLRLVPQPAPGTASVLEYQGPGTVVVRGETPDAPDLSCGGCNARLVSGHPWSAISGLVLRCKRCGAYNSSDAMTL